MDQNIEHEIGERIKKINAYADLNDTVFVDPVAVDKKVNELVLLSKDVENLSASVNLSNQYFAGLSKKFGINAGDFEMLHSAMHVNDIASALRQNEMIFFNHILLKSSKDAIPMHSAR